MRLFLAIDPAEAARSALAEVLRSTARHLDALAPALRWVGAEEAHLTLHFLGEIDEDRGRGLVAAVQQPCDIRSFRVTLDHLGVFPPAGPPRTVWLGVGDGIETVRSVHAELARRLERLGFPVDSRPYAPHLTLARVRDSERHRVRRLRETLTGFVPPPVAWRVTHASLIQSDLSGPRPRYTTLARLALQAEDPGSGTQDPGLNRM